MITQIYGIKNLDDALMCAELGADHIGVAFGQVKHLGPQQKDCAQAKYIFDRLPTNVVKVGLTIALALSGLLLVCTGFDVKFGAGQPEGPVFLMRVLAVTVPASGMLTAILLMAGYRLNAGRMAEVKRELDARRRGSRS